MTKISFLHGAPDRMKATAEWLQQAWTRRQAVLVYVPAPEDAARLDHLLWSQPALSFVPHCRRDAPLANETPILLADELDDPPQDECLINLSNELPGSFSRFEQVIEIVSTDDADRLPARERFKFYRERGYAIDIRDISGGL